MKTRSGILYKETIDPVVEKQQQNRRKTSEIKAKLTQTPPKSAKPKPNPKTTETKSKTTKPKPKTPESKTKTPESKRKTPEPKREIRESKRKAPEPKPRTPEPKRKTIEIEPKTTKSKSKLIETKPKTPEPKPKSTETKPRTRESKSRSTEIKPKTPEPKPKPIETKPKTPESNPESIETVEKMKTRSGLRYKTTIEPVVEKRQQNRRKINEISAKPTQTSPKSAKSKTKSKATKAKPKTTESKSKSENILKTTEPEPEFTETKAKTTESEPEFTETKAKTTESEPEFTETPNNEIETIGEDLIEVENQIEEKSSESSDEVMEIISDKSDEKIDLNSNESDVRSNEELIKSEAIVASKPKLKNEIKSKVVKKSVKSKAKRTEVKDEVKEEQIVDKEVEEIIEVEEPIDDKSSESSNEVMEIISDKSDEKIDSNSDELEVISNEEPIKLEVREASKSKSKNEIKSKAKKSVKSKAKKVKIDCEVREEQMIEEKVEEIIEVEEQSEDKLNESSNEGMEIVYNTNDEKTDLNSNVSEVSSLKRKSEIIEISDEPETSKRLRISRFEVPSISSITGKVYSFGEEVAGELGPRKKSVNGTKVKPNEPSIVTNKNGHDLDNAVQVVCGAMHSCVLTAEGQVITFGCNDDSALGRDTQISGGAEETDDSIDVDEVEEREARTPKVVSGLDGVVRLSAGDMHTCVLRQDGSVFVWGNLKDESKKIGLFEDSLKKEGSDDSMATIIPKQVELSTKIVDIASGCHHILLLTEDGVILSFGEGSKGQLGRIDVNDLQSISSNRRLFLTPMKVEFENGVVIEKIWANHWSSYAKSTSGHIYSWGLNNYHQLGVKSEGVVELTNPDPNESQLSLKIIMELKPIKVEKMPTNVVMLANGQHHMVALDSSGQVFSVGCNLYGKLGFKSDQNLDKTIDSPAAMSRQSFGGHSVSYISCGEFCSFAITTSGQLYSWGQGSTHIGSNFGDDFETPKLVRGVLAEKSQFICVSSGAQHTLVVGNESSVNGN